MHFCFCSIIKNNQKKIVEAFFGQVLPGWIGSSEGSDYPGFLQFLNPNLNPITPTLDCDLHNEIVLLLLELIEEFPKRMKQYIPKLIENLWVLFVNGLSV